MNDLWRKIQNQPEGIRKLILWGAVIIVGGSMLTLWFGSVQKRLHDFSGNNAQERLQLPPVGEKINAEMKNLKQIRETIQNSTTATDTGQLQTATSSQHN